MSQVSIIDIEGNHPQIPTEFVANVGFAIPIANVLEIFGDTQLAGTMPVHTVGVGNNITTYVQISQAIAAPNAANIGLSAFNSDQFSVDPTGFVSLIGSGLAIDSIAVQFGISPVVPDGTGLVTFNGAVANAGVNPVRSHGTAPNTYALEVQISQAVGAGNAATIGLSNFDSGAFAVSAAGFVTLVGTAVGRTITGNSGGALAPTLGNWNIFAAAVAAGTTPAATAGAASTLTVNIQRTQAIASTNAANVGLSAFDSGAFDVDANGFVQLNGGGIAITSIAVDGNTAPGTNPVLPTAAGQITVTGGQVAAGTTTNAVRAFSLAANSLTVQVQRSTTAASSTVGSNGLCHFHSTDFSVDSNAFVSIGVQFTGDSGTAAFSAGNLNILGANGITSSASGSTVTLNGTTNVQTFVATSNNYTFTWTAPAERTLYDVQFAVASGGVAGGGTYAEYALFTKVMTLYMFPATVAVTPITIIAQQADSNGYSCPITAVGAYNSGITVNVQNANTFTVVVTAVKIGSY